MTGKKLRQRGEPVEERVLRPEHHRRAEHRDVEVLGGEHRLLADALGAQVLGRAPSATAPSALMCSTRRTPAMRQAATMRLRQLDVDAREIRTVVVRAALVGPAAPAVQDADQVDHRLLAGAEALERARAP